MSSGKTLVIVAVIVAVVACGGIIAHFMTRPQPADPFAALTQFQEVPSQTSPSAPATEPAVPAQVTVPPAPEAPPAPKAGVVPPPPPPPAPVVESPKRPAPLPVRVVMPPRRLQPEGFVFTPIPHDAPIAEFPLLLVWQRDSDMYLMREFNRFTPPQSALVGRFGSGFFKTNPPPTIPPTEESPSGL
jgi:hypothetical protein